MDKVMFWKRDAQPDTFGQPMAQPQLGQMDMNNPGMLPQGAQQQPSQGMSDLSGFSDDMSMGQQYQDPMNQNLGLNRPSQGIPDPSAYRGVADPAAANEMNQSLYNQMPQQPAGYSTFNTAQPPQPIQQQAPAQASGIDLVSAKLDAIKATVESINQRLANLERLAYGEQNPQKRRDSW